MRAYRVNLQYATRRRQGRSRSHIVPNPQPVNSRGTCHSCVQLSGVRRTCKRWPMTERIRGLSFRNRRFKDGSRSNHCFRTKEERCRNDRGIHSGQSEESTQRCFLSSRSGTNLACGAHCRCVRTILISIAGRRFHRSRRIGSHLEAPF